MRRVILAGPALLLVLFHGLPVYGQEELRAQLMSGGGRTIGNATYELCCTIGDPAVGRVASPSHKNYIGFLMPEVCLVPVAEELALPTAFRLRQNFPNPFNPATTIRFDLPRSERVRVDIYGLDGRRILTLADRTLPAGRMELVWNGRDRAGVPVASGLYVCRLRAGDFEDTKRMILIK